MGNREQEERDNQKKGLMDGDEVYITMDSQRRIKCGESFG